jgi:hypothetical protein
MKCAEIETDFIAWRSPAAIAKEYELSDRSSKGLHHVDHERDRGR